MPCPHQKNLSDLPTVEDTIDVAREDAEANVPLAVPSPKEPGAAERARHELTHFAVQKLVLQLRRRSRSGRRSSQVRRLHRTSKSGMRFHVSVEARASREPRADYLQHDGQGKPVNGCSSHREGCKRDVGAILPGHVGRVGTIRRQRFCCDLIRR